MALIYSIDGNQVCAVGEDFKDLQSSPAGFGDSLKEAFIDFHGGCGNKEVKNPHKWEIPWAEELNMVIINE